MATTDPNPNPNPNPNHTPNPNQAQLVADENEEGNAMSAIKKQWRMEVEMMTD